MNNIVAIIIFAAHLAWSQSNNGHITGNGGGAWVCADKAEIELVEHYEARSQRRVIKEVTGQNEVEVAKKYVTLALMKDMPHLAGRILKNIESFKKNTRFVQSDLVVIEDSMYRQKSPECQYGQVVVQRKKVFVGQKRYLVDEKLWNRLPLYQKALLITHEAIYREVIKMGGEDSRSTRHLNIIIMTGRPDILTINHRNWISFYLEDLRFAFFEYKGFYFDTGHCPRKSIGDCSKTLRVEFDNRNKLKNIFVRSDYFGYKSDRYEILPMVRSSFPDLPKEAKTKLSNSLTKIDFGKNEPVISGLSSRLSYRVNSNKNSLIEGELLVKYSELSTLFMVKAKSHHSVVVGSNLKIERKERWFSEGEVTTLLRDPESGHLDIVKYIQPFDEDLLKTRHRVSNALTAPIVSEESCNRDDLEIIAATRTIKQEPALGEKISTDALFWIHCERREGDKGDVVFTPIMVVGTPTWFALLTELGSLPIDIKLTDWRSFHGEGFSFSLQYGVLFSFPISDAAAPFLSEKLRIKKIIGTPYISLLPWQYDHSPKGFVLDNFQAEGVRLFSDESLEGAEMCTEFSLVSGKIESIVCHGFVHTANGRVKIVDRVILPTILIGESGEVSIVQDMQRLSIQKRRILFGSGTVSYHPNGHVKSGYINEGIDLKTKKGTIVLIENERATFDKDGWLIINEE